MDVFIEGLVTPRIGLASHRNAVPLLRELMLVNTGSVALENLALELIPGRAFVQSRTWQVERLDAGACLAVADREVTLHEDFLAGLVESACTQVRLVLRSAAQVLCERTFPVELLARDEWGGSAGMVELLAAFCLPDDPAIDKVLTVASGVLHAAGRPAAIDGHASGSRQRVWELVSAAWTAVCGLKVRGAPPPDDFEERGQKVCPPTRVFETRVATCLDMALLFAAVLERAGLHPVLALTRGHAFAGAWLQPDAFAQVAIEDAAALRRHVELDELVIFEPMLAAQASPAMFGQALAAGAQGLVDETFVAAVDIHRARSSRWRPLEVEWTFDGVLANDDAPESAMPLEPAPPLPMFDVAPSTVPETAPATPHDCLERWQRELLDLSTRNRLLHVPASARVVRMSCPDPAALEGLLADKHSMRIVPLPVADADGSDDTEDELARQALARGEVASNMEAGKLDATLVGLYRKAGTDLREGGSNTLFLALGFLRWKKAADEPRDYLAPLILVPAKLERANARAYVKLSGLDDEPRFNHTLLELLRRDFALTISGLDGDLPRDAGRVDVHGVWKLVEHAVRDMPGFEVVDDVVLGTFSFAKYLMWRDLVDRADVLAQNEVVKRLLHHASGASPALAGDACPVPETLDRTVVPGELFTPLPADSSQLAAVVASARGQSFVLDGPPGTGKSQTIVNMIAHNLAQGRRVLFVAEKRVALDVVKRRLEAQGIGEFCLELHSNKASRQHVLDQLERAWAVASAPVYEQWDAQAHRVDTLRTRLNALVAALRKRRPNGWTVHEAIGRVVRDGVPGPFELYWPAGTQHDAAAMDTLRHLAHELDLHREVAARGGVAMRLLHRTEWSNEWQETMLVAARHAVAAMDACEAACVRVVEVTGLPVPAEVGTATWLLKLVRALCETRDVDLHFAFVPTASVVQADATKAMVLLREYVTASKRLSLDYSPAALRRIDVEQVAKNWAQADGRIGMRADRGRKRVAKALAAQADSSELPDVAADLPILQRVKTLSARLDALEAGNALLHEIPGWDGLASDTACMGRVLRLAENLNASLVALADAPEGLVHLRHRVRYLVLEGGDLLARDGAVTLAMTQLAGALNALGDAANAFARQAGCDIDLAVDAAALRGAARYIVANGPQLHAWCGWRCARDEAVRWGLAPLVEAIESGTLPDAPMADLFETAYARWFAADAIDAEPSLRHFAPGEHESDIAAYAHAVDELSVLTGRLVRAYLAEQLPDKNAVSIDRGFALLKGELQKRRQHKPVRRLIREMGSALGALAPCMLMSPLSAAQYLPVDHAPFDLVIFDEASQIAPWDAVGAMARGRQVVMAGDLRQMPPTRFFSRGAGAEEDDTGKDLDSILDACLAAGVPRRGLTWHYRSRHESLIRFSNRTYYDDALMTFPPVDTRPGKVGWRRVDGVYARGSGQHNVIEAEAIVAEVMARLTDEAFVTTGQSLGIITLNIGQQRLIEDLLDQARREHPAIEPFFDISQPEPVMVKNLETVQGDERDLVILGIGFGPDGPGVRRMSMNFGPLNRDGGWRRLNVAITRARREMLVFTSFEPSMIDPNRTSARAVHELRRFIEFAAHDSPVAAVQTAGSDRHVTAPLEAVVARALEARGWRVVPRIGVSGFRIDLGVVHPDRPDVYLAGVACDGAGYLDAATARDRDKVREAVLRGLGWQLVRVWSMQWWNDREGAIEQLHRTLTGMRDASRKGWDPSIAASGELPASKAWPRPPEVS